MDTREVNHRRCVLFHGEGIRHLVEEVAQRTPTETVDDVVATMRAQRQIVPAHAHSIRVDMTQHNSRQYVACSGCGKPISVDDVQLNECSNCGSRILSK